MPEDIDNNQSDPSNADRRAKEEEHETHTTALVLLSLATLVVIVAVISVGQSVDDLNPENYGDQTQEVDPSDGSQIPTEQAKTADYENLSGFPDGLPVPDNAEIARNYISPIGDNGNQRVLIYDTQSSRSDIFNSYRAWLDGTDFSIDQSGQAPNSNLRASRNNQRLIIDVTGNDDGRRVQVNYINQN